MTQGATALGYQMMIEGHFIAAMMSAAARDLYHPAALWADNWGALMGHKNPPNIQPPTHINELKEYNQKWMDYFFKKTFDISIFVNKRLDEIRKKYNDRVDIPKVLN